METQREGNNRMIYPICEAPGPVIQAKRGRKADPTSRYAERVCSGKIIAGPSVRAACKRHLQDLKRKDIWFDLDSANRVLKWFPEILRLTSGKWEGTVFKLLPFQQFIVGSIYGWKRKDGLRRFRVAYIEIGKGSGKSPLAAGLAIYSIHADSEPRAQAFVIARTADQALITFKEAVNLTGSCDLKDHLTIYGGLDFPYNISHRASGSFIRRVSSDTQGKGHSGAIVHFLVCDEYHEQDTSKMRDFYELGMKRLQPISFTITNAGSEKDSPCGREHDKAVQVANGDIISDSYFAYVCELDDEDNPYEDESCWIKTNPGLPSLPGHAYIREQIEKTRGMPSARATVERLVFCIWTGAESPWIERDKWIAVETKEEDTEAIKTAPCYLGLDLSMKTDLTAGCLLWDLTPDERDIEEKEFYARITIWTPEETIRQRSERDSAPYDLWATKNFIVTTPGPVIAYSYVAKWIKDSMEKYNLVGVGYDPQFMDLVEIELSEIGVETTRRFGAKGLFMNPHPQGFRAGPLVKNKDPYRVPLYMPRSIDALEAVILREQIKVRYNPAVRSAALGTVVIKDASENRRLTKGKSTTRIDAMVALTISQGFAVAQRIEPIQRGASDFI